PAIDAFDTEHAFVVHASLPGATPNAITVDFEPKTNEVVISGEIRRPGVFADNIDSLRVSERRVGHFERRIRLGSNTKIVAENITAKLVNGVLEVSIPKVAEQPRKRITIE
ncbi:HSP20-like chaperone, partial [Myxozyma melibiosi]